MYHHKFCEACQKMTVHDDGVCLHTDKHPKPKMVVMPKQEEEKDDEIKVDE